MITLKLSPQQPTWLLLVLALLFLAWAIALRIHRYRVLRFRARRAWMRGELDLRLAGRPHRALPRNLSRI